MRTLYSFVPPLPKVTRHINKKFRFTYYIYKITDKLLAFISKCLPYKGYSVYTNTILAKLVSSQESSVTQVNFDDKDYPSPNKALLKLQAYAKLF